MKRYDIDLKRTKFKENIDDENVEPVILNDAFHNSIAHKDNTRAVCQEQAFLDHKTTTIQPRSKKTLRNGNTVETSEGFNCSANSS